MGFQKGSSQALEQMAKIRSMKKGKKLIVNDVEPVQKEKVVQKEEVVVARRGRLVKGSAEAKAFMTELRSKKK